MTDTDNILLSINPGLPGPFRCGRDYAKYRLRRACSFHALAEHAVLANMDQRQFPRIPADSEEERIIYTKKKTNEGGSLYPHHASPDEATVPLLANRKTLDQLRQRTKTCCIRE